MRRLTTHHQCRGGAWACRGDQPVRQDMLRVPEGSGLSPVSTASQPEDHEARGLGALAGNKAGWSRAGPEDRSAAPVQGDPPGGKPLKPGHPGVPGPGLPPLQWFRSAPRAVRSCRPSGAAKPGHPASRGVPGRIVHLSVRRGGRRPCARQCPVPDCLRSAWTETSGARKRRNGLRGQCSGTMILRAYSEMRAESQIRRAGR